MDHAVDLEAPSMGGYRSAPLLHLGFDCDRTTAFDHLVELVTRRLCRRHRSLQYFTSVHTFAHFFRHWNGRPQTMQIFSGTADFFLVIAILHLHRQRRQILVSKLKSRHWYLARIDAEEFREFAERPLLDCLYLPSMNGTI